MEAIAPVEPVPAHPTFTEATKVWATIGFLSFGGPAGQIALMHRMLVEERKWISEARFLHALNFCMLLPGPEAQQLATYVGWLLHGTRGGLVAGTLFVLPGLVVILVLSALYAAFRETDLARHAVLRAQGGGARHRARSGGADRAAGAQDQRRGGDRGGRLRRDLRPRRAASRSSSSAPASSATSVTRVAPDVLVPVAKTGRDPGTVDAGLTQVEPTWRRAVLVTLLSVALWAAPALLLGLTLGFDTIFTDIALFFSWLAVVTFGGAYAVLAYVADAAVASMPGSTRARCSTVSPWPRRRRVR